MKISLTRALNEIKLTQRKIESVISRFNSTTTKQYDKLDNYIGSEKNFIRDYESNMDRIDDLREYKSKLQKALSIANQENTVTIGDIEYTIVEAIRKKSDIEIDKMILSKLKNQLKRVKNTVAHNDEMLEDSIQNTINNKASSSGQNNKDFIETIRKSMTSLGKVEIVNGKSVEEKIDFIESYIEEFESEVDYSLSEVNASTFIEI